MNVSNEPYSNKIHMQESISRIDFHFLSQSKFRNAFIMADFDPTGSRESS
jgi:hypothetical protein